jgi:hypothetical protein
VEHDVAAVLGDGRDVPVMRPPPAQRSGAKAGSEILPVDPAKYQRQSRRGDGGVDGAGQIAHGIEGSRGLRHFKAPESTEVGSRLADGAEVVGVLVHLGDVAGPEVAV